METMTRSFPSGVRNQLDNAIFYAGPLVRRNCESAPSDGEDGTDIDEMLVRAFREELAPGIEYFDFATGFDNANKGEVFRGFWYSGSSDGRMLETQSQLNAVSGVCADDLGAVRLPQTNDEPKVMKDVHNANRASRIPLQNENASSSGRMLIELQQYQADSGRSYFTKSKRQQSRPLSFGRRSLGSRTMTRPPMRLRLDLPPISCFLHCKRRKKTMASQCEGLPSCISSVVIRADMDMKATAVQYLKRFYLSHSCMTYLPKGIYKIFLFLACKTEATHITLSEYARQISTDREQVLDPEYNVMQALRFILECSAAAPWAEGRANGDAEPGRRFGWRGGGDTDEEWD